jgi:hypothetical protein
MVEIPTPKPYIFMIRVTRQIKCLIAQAPGGHPGIKNVECTTSQILYKKKDMILQEKTVD